MDRLAQPSQRFQLFNCLCTLSQLIVYIEVLRIVKEFRLIALYFVVVCESSSVDSAC